MIISQKTFTGMLMHTAELWLQNIDQLSEIDSRFGDGDHGIIIGKIARATQAAAQNAEGKSICELIESLGDSIMGISGGAVWGRCCSRAFSMDSLCNNR